MIFHPSRKYQRTMPKNLTTTEIAKLANVSRGTVDRVLHKRGRVSPKTEEKIRAILKDVNYTPNVYARGLKLSKSFRFGIVIPNTSFGVTYWALPKQGIDRAVQELEQHRVEIELFLYDNYVEDSFDNALQKALDAQESLEGLLIAPVFSKTAADRLATIPANLPFVIIDTDVPNSHYLSFIGTNSFQSGLLSGRLMHMLVPDGGEIAVFRELPENFHIYNRVDGFLSFWETKTKYTVTIYDANREIDPNSLGDLTRTVVQNTRDIHGIYVSGSFSHEVARALDQLGAADKVRVIGYDLTSENRLSLVNGGIDVIISNRPDMQGYYGLYSLFQHIVLKRQIEKTQNMPLDIILKENVEFF
jgi:LacI family transcriptional regulator